MRTLWHTGLLGLAGVAAGLLLTAVFSWLPGERTPAQVALVNDVDGALAEIDIQYNPAFHEPSVETIADLLQALPATTKIHLVVEDRADFDTLSDDLARRGVLHPGLLPVVTGFPISPWAKDRFGTLEADGAPVIALPPDRPAAGTTRGNDGLVPEVLCRELDDVSCHPLPFAFEGGDLLSDGERIYVASTMLARSQPTSAADRQALLDQVAATFGKPVLPVGVSPDDVPDHHIGMFLTPLGQNVVAVADPDLGRRLYEALPAEQQTVQIETSEPPYEPFRYVLRAMEDAGLKTVRIPMLLTTTPRVYVTYNNAIVETRDGQRRIYMPTYGIEPLDQLATAAFTGQGLEVQPVRVGELYENTGSLRCLVGVVRRT